MIKKSGFTLAEVLITLGIIGVVASLTTPSLVGSYQKAKIGPTLRKFMSTIENANQHLLGENDTDKISNVANNAQEYLELLEQYLNGTTARKDSNSIMSVADLTIQPTKYNGSKSDNVMPSSLIYNFNSGDAFAMYFYGENEESRKLFKDGARGSYKGAICFIYYDINGFETKPNRLGKDLFGFYIDDNGTVIPYSGLQQWNAYSSTGVKQAWKNSKDNRCTASVVDNGTSCAGSIADNNWKVIYKY